MPFFIGIVIPVGSGLAMYTTDRSPCATVFTYHQVGRWFVCTKGNKKKMRLHFVFIVRIFRSIVPTKQAGKSIRVGNVFKVCVYIFAKNVQYRLEKCKAYFHFNLEIPLILLASQEQPQLFEARMQQLCSLRVSCEPGRQSQRGWTTASLYCSRERRQNVI